MSSVNVPRLAQLNHGARLAGIRCESYYGLRFSDIQVDSSTLKKKSKNQPLLPCVFGIPCSASLVAKFISGFYSLHPPGPKRATKLPSCEPQHTHTHTHEVASPGRTKYSTISEKLMFVSISSPNCGSKSSFAQQLVPQLGVEGG